ncbi:MAG TPA: M67 family metallopeptidase [Actinomycetota bacterium]|jgi:proteasome lid subunit RPN8/RPN11|nr:M67 family metallopeptidase [Actinomycetota bacterium]
MQLDRVFFDEMVEHGLAAFPNEACGLVAGKEGRPVRFFPMTNADASPVTYRLDPKEQLTVFDEMDDQGWDLLGIFHTHTHSEAYPSDTDRRQAFYPEAEYLVMSLSDRANPVLRSFRIEDDEVAELEIEIG